MADNATRLKKWFRAYYWFGTDPRIQALSEVDQRRYLLLLCLRSKQQQLTDQLIANFLTIKLNDWQATKQRLIKIGLSDSQNEPCDWPQLKYKSDCSTARVQKHRQKNQQLKAGSSQDQTATKLLDYWLSRRREKNPRAKKTMGKSAQQIRLRKLAARLAEGYLALEIKQAIDACFSSPFHLQHGYTDIELICRNGVKLDYFLALSQGQPPSADFNKGPNASLDSGSLPLKAKNELQQASSPAPHKKKLATKSELLNQQKQCETKSNILEHKTMLKALKQQLGVKLRPYCDHKLAGSQAGDLSG